MKLISTLNPGSRPAIEAGARLRKVESLLDRAVEDLLIKGNHAPGAQCTAALTDVVAELRALEGLLNQKPLNSKLPSLSRANLQPENLECANLRQQLSALVRRLDKIGRLLAAAAEFYRGWCAAAPVPGYSAGGYETGGWTDARGPALVAVEA